MTRRDAAFAHAVELRLEQPQSVPLDERAEQVDRSAESISALSSLARLARRGVGQQGGFAERRPRSIAISGDHARSSGLPDGEELAGRLADEIWDIGDGGKQLVRDLQLLLWIALGAEPAVQRHRQVLS